MSTKDVAAFESVSSRSLEEVEALYLTGSLPTGVIGVYPRYLRSRGSCTRRLR